MAIIQAIFAFLARSVGKIFSALFDWAVVALFGRVSGVRKTVLSVVMAAAAPCPVDGGGVALCGRVSGVRKTVLSVVMAAAAAWPVLLLGVAFPRLAVLVLGFIPLSRSVPSGVVRLAWLALVLLVPIGVGIAVRLQSASKDGRPPSTLKSLLRGFPI